MEKSIKRILILGGYGTFGKLIAEGLAVRNGIEILLGGRNMDKAGQACRELAKGKCVAKISPARVDIQNTAFVDDLKQLAPDLVIHTAGPFQGQDYTVPLACIEAGCHYIDLADDRRFVCDIGKLNERARSSNVLVVTGASSVPGLTSTVIDFFLKEFSRLDLIDFCIVPGYKTERGAATIQGILSYTGHPYRVFMDNAWQAVYGWMSPRQLDLGGVLGQRWLANVDIPDLELFPARYRPVRTVRFQAGIELSVLHLAMVGMAWLAKAGMVRNWARYIRPVYWLSRLFDGFGTDVGGMRIHLQGLGTDGQPKSIKWTLIAKNGIGPYIPTLSTIILAGKLIDNTLTEPGARPCLGMYSLDEFDRAATGLGIYHTTEISSG